jgi:Sulfotransferase family
MDFRHPEANVTIEARLFRVADRMAGALGLFERRLDADALIADARNRSWLDDFGDIPIRDGLGALVDAYEREADLSVIGRRATRWDMARFLSNLLRLRREEARDPSVLRERIEAPIFITGLPRSGTTFLHRLLAEDPASLAPRCWQTIYPYPDGDASAGRPDSRARRVNRQLRWFARMAPGFDSAHPLDSETPQECTEITAHVFRSLRFDATHHVPSYRAWLDGAGHLDAYRFHRRFLRHLQHQEPGGGTGRRWVLKSPDHVFALDAIAAIYPDARIVFVHRDPLRVLPSVAKLTEILRNPFARRIDRAQIGRQVTQHWAVGAERMLRASRSMEFPRERVFHMRYRDLVANPVSAVSTLYAHFGLEMRAAAAMAMGRMVEEKPNGGYGRNVYNYQDHGLDPEEERERYAPYLAHFGIEPEVEMVSRGTARPAAPARLVPAAQ